MAEVRRVRLGSQGLEVSAQGLGCRDMSSKLEQDMVALIHHAVDCGITFLDTSDIYGPHANELFLGKALKGIRHRVQLATKFGVRMGIDGRPTVCGDPAYVRSACEASLQRLGVDCIDLYYQHRIDRAVPIEVTVGEMKKLVQEGKVKYLGLSEASASTIRRAHAVHPITAVQLEWSLCTRDAEADIIPTCRELGVGIVAYSPLGRGFLCAGSKLVDKLLDNRKTRYPRFVGENLDMNERLFLQLQQMASRKGCSPGQLALAWVHDRGNDVVPIPGTTRIESLDENVAALQVNLNKVELEEIEAIFHVTALSGARYNEPSLLHTYQYSDTPPLSTWTVS